MAREDLIFRRCAHDTVNFGAAVNFNWTRMQNWFAGPWPLARYEGSVDEVPPATNWPNHLIYVNLGGNAGNGLHVSNGTNWIALNGSDTILAPAGGPITIRNAGLKPVPNPLYFEVPPSLGWASTIDAWFAAIALWGRAPMPLPVFPRASLPDPSVWQNRMILCPDPYTSGGPFKMDQKVRISCQQDYGAGLAWRWLGLDGALTNVDPPASWANIGTVPSTAGVWPTLDYSLAGWEATVIDRMNRWGLIMQLPLPIYSNTRAGWGSIATQFTKWPRCMGIVTNPNNTANPHGADTRLVVCTGSAWQRVKDGLNSF